MNNVHFAIPEIYGETLSYYELLRKIVDKTNELIENYNTVPEQIAEAVANLDASQLFSEVLNQLIHSIATDNTKSKDAVRQYKKHDLLYATFNDTVNLYETITDFTNVFLTELKVDENIREVNISELLIELRNLIDTNKNNISELLIELRNLIDTNKNNIEAVTAVANQNSEEIETIHNDITGIENKNNEQDTELSTLRTMLSSPYNYKGEVSSLSALPASGNVNDTYYVHDVKYKVTWTGSAWVQSSLSEADYENELSELKSDLVCYQKDNKYIGKYDKYTTTITNGNDVIGSNKDFESGKRYVALSSNKSAHCFVYSSAGQSDSGRKYFSNGYVAFDGWGNYGAYVSGAGTFTTTIMYFDVTNNTELEEALKTAIYDGTQKGGVYLNELVVYPKNLSDDIANNFLSLKDEFFYGSKSTIGTYAFSNIEFDGGHFTATSTNVEPHHIVNTFLSAGKKYAVYYSFLADSDYSIMLRTYDSPWKQIIKRATQTANVVSSDTVIFDCTENGYIGIDCKFANAETNIECTIKIYDITDKDLSVIKSLDFSTMPEDIYTLNVERIHASNDNDMHLLGKKIVYYGDSITSQNYYPPIVTNHYKMTQVNLGYGGSTVTYKNDNSFSSDTRINEVPTDSDIVLIMGGTNDWGKVQIEETLTYNNGFDRTKFKGALAYTIKGIQERCPSAKIIVCTLIGGRNETRGTASETIQYLPQKDRFNQTDLDFRNAEIEVCEMLNIDVCDTWSCGINGVNSMSTIADTVHPTRLGAEMISDYIIGYLKSVII